jgi:hypothetical protein
MLFRVQRIASAITAPLRRKSFQIPVGLVGLLVTAAFMYAGLVLGHQQDSAAYHSHWKPTHISVNVSATAPLNTLTKGSEVVYVDGRYYAVQGHHISKTLKAWTDGTVTVFQDPWSSRHADAGGIIGLLIGLTLTVLLIITNTAGKIYRRKMGLINRCLQYPYETIQCKSLWSYFESRSLDVQGHVALHTVALYYLPGRGWTRLIKPLERRLKTIEAATAAEAEAAEQRPSGPPIAPGCV